MISSGNEGVSVFFLMKKFIYKYEIKKYMKDKISEYFEQFLEKDSLFNNKQVMQSNYNPNEILHRDNQIKNIAQILAPTLKLEKPSNLFIYGKSGTGKTLVVKHVIEKIKNLASAKNLSIEILYINCKLRKVADTEYRLLAELARKLGKSIPSTGLPTEDVYNVFFSTVDQEKKMYIIVLDEMDQIDTSNNILYNLTRINSELKNSQITLIGISNDLGFTDMLDPRVKSSLSEEELVFPPYNAVQIQEILRKRTLIAFKENTIEGGVIEKCAALAARDHGDARRAIELMRVAGELAERKNMMQLTLKHLDEAEQKIEKDRIIDMVNTQPKQFQAILFTIFLISESNDNIFTGDIYDSYIKLCKRVSLMPLTQRRVSDIIMELDMLGIINAKVISKGRYGRTREITLSIPENSREKVRNILSENLNI